MNLEYVKPDFEVWQDRLRVLRVWWLRCL